MKNYTVKTLIILFTLLSFNAYSQSTSKKLHITPMVGFNKNIRYDGNGFCAAISAAYDINHIFSFESQVSYFQNRNTTRFIFGNEEFVKGGDISGGLRFNLIPHEKSFSVYTNFMLGMAYSSNYLDGEKKFSNVSLPIQIGLFTRFKRIVTGASYSSFSKYDIYAGFIF